MGFQGSFSRPALIPIWVESGNPHLLGNPFLHLQGQNSSLINKHAGSSAFPWAKPSAKCFNALTHLILTVTQWSGYSYYFHFTDEEIEVWRSQVIRPRLVRGGGSRLEEYVVWEGVMRFLQGGGLID